MILARVRVALISPRHLHQHDTAVFQVFQTMGKCSSLAAGHGHCRRSTEVGHIGRLDRRLQKWTLTQRGKWTVQADYQDQCLRADSDHAPNEASRYNSKK